MSYKKEVVNTAIKSLEESGFPGAVSLSIMFLLERVYDCGYNEALRNHELDQMKRITYPVVGDPKIGCPKCGLGGYDVYQVMGYVCPRSDCPTKVTC